MSSTNLSVYSVFSLNFVFLGMFAFTLSAFTSSLLFFLRSKALRLEVNVGHGNKQPCPSCE